MIDRWLLAFALTQLIETPIYVYAQRRDGPSRSVARRALIALGASAITHPPLWSLAPRAWVFGYLAVISAIPSARIASPAARYALFVLIAETIVILIEALYFKLLGLRRALWWALVANTASVLTGFVARSFVGFP
jgi:hypothetical protein